MKASDFKKAILIVLFTMSFSGFSSVVINDTLPKRNDTVMTDERGKELIKRLKEIKNMDRSDLSGTDKKELRKEARSIKAELTAADKGVYLTVGAVLVGVLLLIILL